MVYPSEHRNNREKYLELIAQRGLKPRFSSFLDNPNYMKLVNETRQSEAQTSPLQPVYDLEAAEASFAKFVDKGGYYEGWYNDGIDVNAEAEIVLYATWGYQTGHASLTKYGKNTQEMEMKLRAAYTLIVGENELETGKAQLKNMEDCTQTEVALADLVSIL